MAGGKLTIGRIGLFPQLESKLCKLDLIEGGIFWN